jgi:hypothetical protein
MLSGKASCRLATRVPVVVALAISITATTSIPNRSMAALCDLGPLTLPAKYFPSQLGRQQLSIGVDARLDFQLNQQGTFTITETVNARLPNARDAVSRYLQEQTSDLPNEDCGAQLSVDNSDVATNVGDLVIITVIQGQEWGCMINVKALLAEGTLTFRIAFHPTLANKKIKLTPTVTHTGNLMSTIPDIDPELTARVDEQIRGSIEHIVEEIDKSAAGVGQKLDSMQSSTTDPTEALEPLYRPQFLSIAFALHGAALLLTQKRQATSREGTACTIRSVAASKWNEI